MSAASASPTAELSALASSLDDLHARIGSLAHQLDREQTQRAAIDLFEVERSLRTARRRMERALMSLKAP